MDAIKVRFETKSIQFFKYIQNPAYMKCKYSLLFTPQARILYGMHLFN